MRLAALKKLGEMGSTYVRECGVFSRLIVANGVMCLGQALGRFGLTKLDFEDAVILARLFQACI